MANLNDKQLAALERVRLAAAEYKDTRARALAEAQREAERRIAIQQQTLDLAIRNAVDIGVPKSRIHLDAMNVKNPYAVYDSLKRTDPHNQHSRGAMSPFTWDDKAAGLIAINYAGFPTTNPDEEYPAILSGVVKWSADGSSFTVIRDDTEKVTEFGTVPGVLDWELRRPETVEPRLETLLREWLAVNG